MSKETAKKLIAELQTNEELKAKTAGITDKDELVKMAVEAGYDVTLEEMTEAEKVFRAEMAQKSDELSAAELESAAGGGLFMNETAPDGHEYDCVTSYHDFGYQTSRQEYCKDKYYCPSTSQTKYCFKDYH